MRAFFNHGVTWLFSARFSFKVIICSIFTFKIKQNKMKQNTLWQSNLCKVIPRQSVPFYCIFWAITSFRYEFTTLTSKFAIIFSANWMPNQLNLLQLDKGRCFDKRSFSAMVRYNSLICSDTDWWVEPRIFAVFYLTSTPTKTREP